ncbi:LTA synthase family protein [Shouchella clausii]|uniref:LTA synthase family protein n=1 Tax=Shouchella clausii TaxID=79880 RepID=UPI000B9785D7|nr:LTA synthase family protein [Shouchella clausii]AST96580.1 glycerol phosphate lipoteichoic acid synthase [Shouchella clausii]MEB5471181.1 LTA synthase family protein [Shouchella clausii]QNM42937.1 LTA synthase family protein [Shouchella clausii]WQG94200.1 LTA synthase family protein [Shouchella clausii]
MSNLKRLASKKLMFFWLALFLYWLKTYVTYKTEFNLGVKGPYQELLLALNPLSMGVLLFGLALFAKGRRSNVWIIIFASLLGAILYANVLFYRFFDDFITLPNVMQASNLSTMSGNVFAAMRWYDLWFFFDVAVLMILYFWKREVPEIRFRKSVATTAVVTAVALFVANLTMAEIDRPQLLARTFDRNYIVKYLGLYNYTIYDGIQTVQAESQRAYASSDDLTEIENYTVSRFAKPNEDYFGIAEGKNIIKIHLESFQSFLIDYELNGEEVTPFLNSLAAGAEDMTYFDNFFHQTGQGKTADAELMLDTGLFGLPQGSAFVTKAQNTYQSLPAILNQEHGHESAVLHGDYKSFWNRDTMYKQLGIDQFFDASYYDMSEENTVNLGLKDKPFFEESIPMLESLETPFYAHLISLTNHYPFNLDPEDATIERATTGDNTVDNYFQTARYLDEALEQFFADLKASGLYEDSVIMIYGDHNGISENHNRAMAEILGTEITPHQNAQNQRVPLLIRVPGMEGGMNHTYGGEIDVMATLLHLQGISAKPYVQFGTDLFSEEHDEIVSFRSGDYITPAFTSVNGVLYDTETGEILEPTEETTEIQEKVDQQLDYSDRVLYEDLLRFHAIDGFEPIEPTDYYYGNPNKEPANEDE